MYDLTLCQNGHFNKKTNQKNHEYFIPHAFNQNIHPFGQCAHFNQAESFEKPWFAIVGMNAYIRPHVCL